MAKRKVHISPGFGRKLKKLKKQEKSSLDCAVMAISDTPSLGEAKVGDLSGGYVYKFKLNKQLTLLAYHFDDHEICLLNFGGHENFYRDLK